LNLIQEAGFALLSFNTRGAFSEGQIPIEVKGLFLFIYNLKMDYMYRIMYNVGLRIKLSKFQYNALLSCLVVPVSL